MDNKNNLDKSIFHMIVKTKKTFGWKDRGFYLFKEGYKLVEFKDGKLDKKNRGKFYPLKHAQIIQEQEPNEISILHYNEKHKYIKFQNKKEKEKFLFQLNFVIYEIAKRNAYSKEYYLKEEEIEKMKYSPSCEIDTILFKHFQNLLSELGAKIEYLKKFLGTFEYKIPALKILAFSLVNSFICIKDELMKQFEDMIIKLKDEKQEIKRRLSMVDSSYLNGFDLLREKEYDRKNKKSFYVSAFRNSQFHMNDEDRKNTLDECEKKKKNGEGVNKEEIKVIKEEKEDSTNKKENILISNNNEKNNITSSLTNTESKPLIRRKQLKAKIKIENRKFEPLSMLQRQCEKFVYSSILSKAKAINDNKCIRLAYIAAFYIGSLSLNINRFLPPFNPLLGETYEYTEENNNNLKYLAEQVSIEPSICAFIGENDIWSFYGDTREKSKLHFFFKGEKGHYVITQPSKVKEGIMEIQSKSDCKGTVCISDTEDPSFTLVFNFNEALNSKLKGAFEGSIKENNIEKYKIKGNLESFAYYCVQDGENKMNIWQITDDKYLANKNNGKDYNLPSWSYELNNIQKGIHDGLPPTDSRLRPDLRKSEEGDIDSEQEIRNKLELKMKNCIKKYEEQMILYQPNYFNEVFDQYTGDYVYIYKGGYWEDRENNNFYHLEEDFYCI